MRVIREGDRGYVYNGRFTGPVQLEMIIEAEDPGLTGALGPSDRATEVDLARIHHESGAVTHWHSHPGGQILTLVSGTGRVGSVDGTTTGIAPGTVIRTAPDEPHWHGADDGADCVWLATTWGVTDWTDDSPLGAP
ncbi:cupin domain-containing protein [Leucobacter iarius]|uniref:Cupin type-2 domain-containing protein n=1 Tax=Leucobacter iarius TaxID=333963 RepID=A0ABP4XI61_9MICO